MTGTEEGARWIVEGAAAYAVVKLLLPVRAALSLYLMPWFAKTIVIPCTRIFRVFARKPKNVKPADEKIWEQELQTSVAKKTVDKQSDKPQL